MPYGNNKKDFRKTISDWKNLEGTTPERLKQMIAVLRKKSAGWGKGSVDAFQKFKFYSDILNEYEALQEDPDGEYKVVCTSCGINLYSEAKGLITLGHLTVKCSDCERA